MLQSRVDRIGASSAQAGQGRDALLEISGLSKSFAGFQALRAFDLDIRRGEFFTMLGPSGSGKTTTLRLIAGFERPDAGRILLDGQDVSRLAPFERDLNTVFQDYALFPHMTVAENIAYGLQARRVGRAETRERVAEALRMVQLSEQAERRPDQLSGGQKQRVGLARALVNRPKLLLLDEPLGALDLKLRQQMQSELKHLQRELGLTFLYVTHDQEEALSMSDRIAVFNEGRIEQVGTPTEIYARPATAFVAGFVGTSSILERGGRRLVLRPEKVMLSPDPARFAGAGWQSESAVVEEVVYLGLFTSFTLRLDSGERLIAAEQNSAGPDAPRPGPGDRLWAGWHEDGIHELTTG